RLMPVPVDGNRRVLAAILFMGGVEIADNGYGSVCSSPQTTTLRVSGQEGGGATEETLFKWVWVANAKCLLLTGLGSLIARKWWPVLGGLASMIFMHACYIHAARQGRALTHTPMGRRIAAADVP